MTLLSLNRGGILGLMLTLFLFGLPLRAEKGRVVLLPTPNVVRLQSDSLRFNCGDRLRIKADEEALAAVRLWNSTLPATSDIRMDITRRKRADIHFVKDTTIPHEGYSLSVTPRGITVSAAGHAGFVYAVQTLRQLTSTDKGLALPCLEISDAPRVGWRSLMLDSGRQYQRVETLKKYIDLASMLKMNYFHWHLTEGLGWRVEIKRYPRLTSVGAFVADGPEQQGFYTQQDIREIVRYAQERAVTVVPEIDMPGHWVHLRPVLRRTRQHACLSSPRARRGMRPLPLALHPLRWRRGPQSRMGPMLPMPDTHRQSGTPRQP